MKIRWVEHQMNEEFSHKVEEGKKIFRVTTKTKEVDRTYIVRKKSAERCGRRKI